MDIRGKQIPLVQLLILQHQNVRIVAKLLYTNDENNRMIQFSEIEWNSFFWFIYLAGLPW